MASNVNLKYKGQSIAQMTQSGSKTLKTQGKYCEADILVEAVFEGESVEPEYTSYSIENQAIVDFDDEVAYTSDYSSTRMGDYDHPISYTKYGKPEGASPSNIVTGTMELIDVSMGTKHSFAVTNGEIIYNIAPNSTGKYIIRNSNDEIIAVGELHPSGKVRTVMGETITNMRDLGGWNCDGGTVKYGILFRGAETTGSVHNISQAEKDMIEHLFGLKCEIDLRDTSEGGGTRTWGNTVDYLNMAIGNYADALASQNLSRIKTVIEKIMNNAIKGIPTFYHCVAGADRTGTLSWLILGILGVSQSDCDKEYELTNLSGPSRFRNRSGGLSTLYSAIMAKGRDTFNNNCIETCLTIGIDIGLVNDFRKAMIDGTPSDVFYNTPLAITSNGTSDCEMYSKVSVNVPQPFHTGTFTPNADTGMVMIDVGFSGCTRLVIFCDTAPELNKQDAMCWNGTTNLPIWSRYRGSYNGAYGSDSGSVTVSGTNVTVTTTQSNCYFNRNKTYTWVAW